MRSNRPSLETLDGLGIFDLMVQALTFPLAEAEKPGPRNESPDDVAAKAPVCGRGMLERLDNWFWIRRQRATESHLAKATDVFELEARMRALEREVPNPYY